MIVSLQKLSAVEVSSDGRNIAAVSEQGNLLVYDTETLSHSFNTVSGVESLSILHVHVHLHRQHCYTFMCEGGPSCSVLPAAFQYNGPHFLKPRISLMWHVKSFIMIQTTATH